MDDKNSNGSDESKNESHNYDGETIKVNISTPSSAEFKDGSEGDTSIEAVAAVASEAINNAASENADKTENIAEGDVIINSEEAPDLEVQNPSYAVADEDNQVDLEALAKAKEEKQTNQQPELNNSQNVSSEPVHENKFNYEDRPDKSIGSSGIVAGTQAEVVQLKERNKHLRIWLVVLIVLLVSVASALVVYFFEQSKANTDLDAANQRNKQLQNQITEQQQSDAQQELANLNTQITEEQQKLQKLTEEIAAKQKTIDELVKKCGSACNGIEVDNNSAINTDNSSNQTESIDTSTTNSNR